MKYILLILAGFLLASCSSSVYKQPMLASTKAIAVPKYKALGTVESKACDQFTYVMFIPFSTAVDFKKLYGKVHEQTLEMGGDAVIDFQVRVGKRFGILFPLPPFVYFVSNCYSVTGVAVKFTGFGSAWDESSAWEQAPSDGSSNAPSVWEDTPAPAVPATPATPVAPEQKEQNKPETKSAWD